MLKTIAPAEMKRVENQVMARTSVTGEQLMQRAAAHVADAAARLADGQTGSIVCLCGNGNNGGDGMAAMRMLWEKGFCGECRVLPGILSADAERELQRLRGTGIAVCEGERALAPLPEDTVCVIDALFGTGLSRPLEGDALRACCLMNENTAPVVAVDIPSGLHGLTGQVLGNAVRADCTVTFHRPKPGLYLAQGPDHAGEIIVGEIGIPDALDDAAGMSVLEEKDLYTLLPKRARVSHKGNYGRVLIWAGSFGMAGAAAIAALAALRTGAGLVTVACPQRIVDTVQVLCPCATCLPLPEDADEAWLVLKEAVSRCDALAAGCGLGKSQWAAQLLKNLVQEEKPMVLDADALNLLAQEGLTAADAFITPHPAEAARMLQCNTADVVADAAAAAARLGKRVVLKGACSVLYAHGQFAVNPFGTPAMAKGGSGDALTGIMAALLAGRQAGSFVSDDLCLMQTACALHGLAGERAQQQFGERGVLATDLCAQLGLVAGEKPNIKPQIKCAGSPFLGREVTVVVEHAQGTRDEADRSLIYRRPCGYVQEVLEEQNEWQDACVLGVSDPVEWFEGTVSAVCRCENRQLWVVTPAQLRLTREEVKRETAFLGSWTHVDCL